MLMTIHPHPPRSAPTPPHLQLFYFHYPPSPVSAAHIPMGVGPCTGTWWTYTDHILKNTPPPTISSSLHCWIYLA